MEYLDIVSFTFSTRKVHSAIYTDQSYLEEIIVFVLGEQLILGPTEPYEFRGRMYDYILSILDPLDIPMAEQIVSELKKRIDSISSELVYRSLYLSGECFLKYEYELHNRHSKLYVYGDTYEFSDENH